MEGIYQVSDHIHNPWDHLDYHEDGDAPGGGPQDGVDDGEGHYASVSGVGDGRLGTVEVRWLIVI